MLASFGCADMGRGSLSNSLTPTEDALRARRDFLGQVCGPYTVLRFSNIGANESLELTYHEFEKPEGEGNSHTLEGHGSDINE